jgi:Tol biopolymer transport system component
MGRSLAFALALLSACGRTDLDGGLLAGSSQSDGGSSRPGDSEPDPPDATPPAPPDAASPDELAPNALPEVCVSARVEFQGTAPGLFLFAPLESDRGPYRVNDSDPRSYAFSPGGTRFVFADDRGLFSVSGWPPESTRIDPAVPVEVAFVDDARLVVDTGVALELHDLDSGTRETLLEVPPSDAVLPPLYLARPSPDARWLAYGRYSAGIHEVWLLDLQAPQRSPVRIMTLPAGAVVAWFDWAPDSEHLAISATDSDGVWLRAYSVATKRAPFEVHSISFELVGDASIPTFDWSPTGDALHYLYQDVDLSGESDWRLYFVDMTKDAPGPSVRLSEFGERNWPSQGYWSPRGDMVAFEAEFAGSTFRAAEFVTWVHDDLQLPEKQHPGEFASVLKQEWSPDSQALYFTAQGDDERERVYRSDLSGVSVLVSSPADDVRGLYVSPDPECIAYSRYAPDAALVIADEATATNFPLREPENIAPGWTGDFDMSQAMWVTDRSGIARGLLYVMSASGRGDAIAWTDVHDCVPSDTVALFSNPTVSSIYDLRASTTPPSGERR